MSLHITKIVAHNSTEVEFDCTSATLRAQTLEVKNTVKYRPAACNRTFVVVLYMQ